MCVRCGLPPEEQAQVDDFRSFLERIGAGPLRRQHMEVVFDADAAKVCPQSVDRGNWRVVNGVIV